MFTTDIQKEGLTFGQVLVQLKNGAKVRRPGWKNFDFWLVVKELDSGSIIMLQDKMSASKWGMRQEDVMSDDWEVIGGQNE